MRLQLQEGIDMFETLKAATRLPLQCASPAYFAFTAAARSGALGFIIMRLCSPRRAVIEEELLPSKPPRPHLRLVVDNDSA
jgi:hypothetical protein